MSNQGGLLRNMLLKKMPVSKYQMTIQIIPKQETLLNGLEDSIGVQRKPTNQPM